MSEEHPRIRRKRRSLKGNRAFDVVDANQDHGVLIAPTLESLDIGVMEDGQVLVCHHRATSVPIALSDDMDSRDIEGIRRPYDRSDIEIVLPVLDRDMQWSAAGIKISDDLLDLPIAVLIEDVAAISIFK